MEGWGIKEWGVGTGGRGGGGRAQRAGGEGGGYAWGMNEIDPEQWSHQGPSQEWNVPDEAGSPTHRRAAMMLWITSGVEIVLFGFFAIVTLVLGLISADTLRRLASPGNINTPQFQELLKMHKQLAGGGVGQLLVYVLPDVVVFVIPAFVLFVLALKVRKSRPLANKIARIILYIQSFVIALELVSTFLSGNLPRMLLTFIVSGGLLALLIATVRALLAARDTRTTRVDRDPWGQ